MITNQRQDFWITLSRHPESQYSPGGTNLARIETAAEELGFDIVKAERVREPFSKFDPKPTTRLIITLRARYPNIDRVTIGND